MSANKHVHILDGQFDPWHEAQKYQQKRLAKGCYGALSLFIGTMRDFNRSDAVCSMNIEHYEAMTEKYIADAVASLMAGWELEDVLVIHRVGRVCPGDPIVMVAVWAAHRHDAYAANRTLVEKLKSEAPFWKKESLPDSERWVSAEDEATRS